MKLIGALLAAVAAAAVIPYRVEVDKENKTLRLKSLTYELEASSNEDGEKSVKINILPDLCCDEQCPEDEDDAVMCDEDCEGCENLFNCPKDAEADDKEETAEGEENTKTDAALCTDEKFSEAVEIALSEGKISTSMLQRKLQIGYGRATKLIDAMQKAGIVSAPDGQKPRTVLITKEEWDAMS